MRGIKNRESGKWKKVAVFLVLLLVFSVLLNSVRKVYNKKKNAEIALARMETEALELRERSEFLKGALEKLETREGIEFEIRKKLNVAGAGESVAVIVEEGPSTSSSKLSTSTWQKFKNFFVELFE